MLSISPIMNTQSYKNQTSFKASKTETAAELGKKAVEAASVGLRKTFEDMGLPKEQIEKLLKDYASNLGK